MRDVVILILAAGRGTRMRSNTPKVLHQLAGRPLLGHVIDTARAMKPNRIVVVVGHEAEQVEAAFSAPDIAWAPQTEQLGTGHAVQCALPALGEAAPGTRLVILSGDVPLVSPDLLTEALADHEMQGRTLTMITTTPPTPTGYGRVVRGVYGAVERVVEEKDADPTIRAIGEINTGIYLLNFDALAGWLEGMAADNAQGEYYLTDIITRAAEAAASGAPPVGGFHHPDSVAFAGINSRAQLASLEGIYRDRLIADWMERGVTFIDPGSCWVAADAEIGQDTIIQPNVILGSGAVIGPECRIGPFCQIRDSRVGAGTEILAFCHLDGADLEGPNTVGPYARLRPGAVLMEKARVGNFCEVKKSRVGVGSKVNHLTYIGDAQIGAGVNVGAGTITCNYDGKNKHPTILEDNVFIGSNTELVAPVRVGAGATVGAGSTVTKDVPPGALAITRAPQRTVNDWASRKKKG